MLDKYWDRLSATQDAVHENYVKKFEDASKQSEYISKKALFEHLRDESNSIFEGATDFRLEQRQRGYLLKCTGFQGKALVLREAARDNRFSDFEAAWDQLEKGVVCTKENGHSVYHLDAGNGTGALSARGLGASTSTLLNYALLSNSTPTEQHQLIRYRRTQLNQPSKRSRAPEPNAEPPQQDSLPNLWPPVPGMPLWPFYQQQVQVPVTLTPTVQAHDKNRIRTCHILIFLGILAVLGSLVPALWRSIARDDISGGFSLAQYILGVGVFVIGCMVAIHSKTCTCWQ